MSTDVRHLKSPGGSLSRGWLPFVLSLGLVAAPMLMAPSSVLAEDGDPVLIGRVNE